ncbi:MAG: hypothetical protein P8P36_06020 [Akkermansiaceae bacterium]|nr:hypothetical protein [Akkermansiaceae bacterium]
MNYCGTEQVPQRFGADPSGVGGAKCLSGCQLEGGASREGGGSVEMELKRKNTGKVPARGGELSFGEVPDRSKVGICGIF